MIGLSVFHEPIKILIQMFQYPQNTGILFWTKLHSYGDYRSRVLSHGISPHRCLPICIPFFAHADLHFLMSFTGGTHYKQIIIATPPCVSPNSSCLLHSSTWDRVNSTRKRIRHRIEQFTIPLSIPIQICVKIMKIVNAQQ